jgi:hypothetical protein
MHWAYCCHFVVVGPPRKLEPLAWHGIIAAVFSVVLALIGFYRGLSALSELHLQVIQIVEIIICPFSLCCISLTLALFCMPDITIFI